MLVWIGAWLCYKKGEKTFEIMMIKTWMISLLFLSYIHSSIFQTLFIQFRVVARWVCVWDKQDRQSCTLTVTPGDNLESPINLTWMCVPRENPCIYGENMLTVLLWGDSAPHSLLLYYHWIKIYISAFLQHLTLRLMLELTINIFHD